MLQPQLTLTSDISLSIHNLSDFTQLLLEPQKAHYNQHLIRLCCVKLVQFLFKRNIFARNWGKKRIIYLK